MAWFNIFKGKISAHRTNQFNSESVSDVNQQQFTNLIVPRTCLKVFDAAIRCDKN